jgi:16S rRNA (cytosine967-C5)-methyltransferase
MRITSLLGHTHELFGEILKFKKPADSLIDAFFRSHKYLGSHDRRFIAETTYGTLRLLRKCEHHLTVALADLCDDLLEDDRIFLLLITYLFFEGKISDDISAILSDRLKSLRLRENISLFLSNLEKPPARGVDSVFQRIGIEYSYPDWMVGKFIQQYGEAESEKICSSLNMQAPLTLRVNTLKASVDQCQEELRRQGIESRKTLYSPFGLILTKRINVFSLPIFRQGWFEVQDEGSQLLPVLFDPKPNAKVLDVCAGAGGKTLEIAALMKNRGEIFATDINGFRLEELRKRTKRAGIQNVRVLEIETIDDLVDRYTGFFDLVFVDAPCSGLGTIRRNPGMKWMVNERTVIEVSEKQKNILRSSAPLVKQGGKLAYTTCTLLKQENEEVIQEFLELHPEFSIVKPNMDIPLIRSLGESSESSFLKLFPHLHGTDGFFCVVLKKQAMR